MKIAHVLSSYLPDHIAGTEVYVAALVRELKKINIISQVIIPFIGNFKNENYFFEDTEVIKYAEPSLEERSFLTGKLPPKGLSAFIQVLKQEKPDIVHFHEVAGGVGVGIFHVKAAKKMGFKTVISFHLAKYTCKTGTLMYMNKTKCDGVIRELACSNCWLNESGEKGIKYAVIKAGFLLMDFLKIDTRFLNNRVGTALALPRIIADSKKNLFILKNNTNYFIALTEWYKNVLLRNGIPTSHINLIKQGIPNNDFVKNNIHIGQDKLRLIFIGRISHFKGLDVLLSAMSDISTNKVELDIYGTSTEEDYENLCLKIAAGKDNIRWKGSILPHLVVQTIKAYDILCIPSSVCEMSPLVIQEAFAAGVPVLASDVYGNAEQITDGENGWLFKFKDIADLKNKIELLIQMPLLIKNAKEKIPTVKSFELVAEEHAALYVKVLAE